MAFPPGKQLPGQTAGGPGPLQIIAAAVTVDVQHLARGIQAGAEAALQRLRGKFVRADAARRHLRGVKAHRAEHGQSKGLDGPADLRQPVRRERAARRFE